MCTTLSNFGKSYNDPTFYNSAFLQYRQLFLQLATAFQVIQLGQHPYLTLDRWRPVARHNLQSDAASYISLTPYNKQVLHYFNNYIIVTYNFFYLISITAICQLADSDYNSIIVATKSVITDVAIVLNINIITGIIHLSIVYYTKRQHSKKIK